jgi:hypothetical protein
MFQLKLRKQQWKSQLQILQEVFIFHQLEDSKLLVEVAQAHQPQNPEQVQFKSHVKYNTFKNKKNTLIPGKKEKGAPDLNNQEYFPTLSAAVAIEQNNLKLKK